MIFSNILRMAFKNLISNKSRTFVTIIGIIIGIGSIVFLVSLGYGLQDLVKSRVADMDELYNIDVTLGGSSVLKISQNSISKIKNLSNIDSIYPIINTGAKIHYSKTATDVIAFSVSSDYLKKFDFKPELGNQFNDKKNEIMINKAASEMLGFKESKDIINKDILVDMVLSKNLMNDNKKTISNLKYKIVGIYNAESSPYIYLPQKTLLSQGIINFSSLKVRVKNKNKILETRKAIENLGFKTEYIGDTISQIDSVFKVFKIVLASFGLIATLVAALGMFNTLTVTLLERIREIGLMKALGATKKDIYYLFLTESLVMGILGGFLGLIVGYGFGFLLNLVLNIFAVSSGNQAIGFFHTPVLFAVLIVCFSVFIGFITGIYPAKKAVRINPLDALRYE